MSTLDDLDALHAATQRLLDRIAALEAQNAHLKRLAEDRLHAILRHVDRDYRDTPPVDPTG